MIIHSREIGYGTNYPEFFAALSKSKAFLEKKYPEGVPTKKEIRAPMVG